MTEERDYKKVAEFAVPFAYAMVKLKKAFDAGEGADLTADEVRAVIDSLKLLSGGVKK